ncbi:SLC13 family permease [Nocardioides sp.]|uniref:SLC13 family permease n=1 Tax=Nocardioides sp. TaxID=35761 RepID=UPI003D1026D1
MLIEAVEAAWQATWPVLLFLVVITLVSDLCADARVFDVAAHLFARAAGGRTLLLFALYCLLATVTTVLLSIDTTAVMLTPVALALAAELDLPPLPFAFATIWLANGASLLLPISNLSNLLAVERTGQSAGEFVADLWLPQLVVLVVVLGVLFVRFRASIRGRYAVPRVLPAHDRVLVVAASVIALGIAIGTVVGTPAWLAATIGLLLLVGLCLLRDPALVRPARLFSLVPARIVLGAFALFVLVELALVVFEPDTIGWPNDVVLAGSAAVLSNAVNNLPAWLALAPVTPSSSYPALLVGINVGGMLLLWGSLANLLWLRRCAKVGVTVTAARFAKEGVAVVPLAVLLGALACGLRGAG